MRYPTLFVSIAFLLGCGGIFQELGSRISIDRPPDDFSCPAGTHTAGGSWPEGRARWQSIPYPAPIFEPGLDRWLELDAGMDELETSMEEGDEHWWCERADGSRQGPYVSIHPVSASDGLPEGTVRVVKGTFSSGRPHGSWQGAVHVPDAPPNPLFSGNYSAGELDGTWTWFCGPGCTNELTLSASYEQGLASGSWLWVGADEEIVATWRNDVLDGAYLHRWDTTVLMGQFLDGQRVGSWKTRRATEKLTLDPARPPADESAPPPPEPYVEKETAPERPRPPSRRGKGKRKFPIAKSKIKLKGTR